MKNLAIEYLKELNKGKNSNEITTRLYYNDREYVQDLSYFANLNYMTQGLLNALQNGQTLTGNQEKELQAFIIEKRLYLQDVAVNTNKYNWSTTENHSKVNEIINDIWSKLKESIEQEKIAPNQFNFTVNIASTATFDVAKFTEQMTKALKRQRGVY